MTTLHRPNKKLKDSDANIYTEPNGQKLVTNADEYGKGWKKLKRRVSLYEFTQTLSHQPGSIYQLI